MSDTPAPSPAPAPAPAPSPAPAPAPVADRPAYVPEMHWDATKGTVNHETFGAHYSELATFKQQHDERQAALATRKADDIKLEIKIPEGFKLPDGIDPAQLTIDEKDPRVPIIRELALKNGWDQETVNSLVWLDAQAKIHAHAEEMNRIDEADKTLGANAKDRKAAVGNWLKGMLERQDITAEEYKDALELATYPSTITLFEKLMAKAAGTVPGAGAGNPPQPPKQTDAPMEQRWYTPQQKVS